VRAERVEPLAGTPSLECTLVDETGGVCVVFLGRRRVEGVQIGASVTVEGMVIEHRGRLAIVNPVYELQ
jgi:DNA/RNA endonuclease YhcR with UshA esterase domain